MPMIVKERVCKDCGAAFTSNRTRCRACYNAHNNALRFAPRDRICAKCGAAIFGKKNECRPCFNAYMRGHKSKLDPTLRILAMRIKLRCASRPDDAYGSRGRELTCSVDFDHLRRMWDQQAGRCAISGLPMDIRRGTLRSVSIDRIDSRLGYQPGNVQLVCKWANYAKHEYPNQDMLAIVAEIRAT